MRHHGLISGTTTRILLSTITTAAAAATRLTNTSRSLEKDSERPSRLLQLGSRRSKKGPLLASNGSKTSIRRLHRNVSLVTPSYIGFSCLYVLLL
ncbi:hypothetical protein OIU84_001655 [Salix udensis]|uniref:Secreted protein n=1 Tax=Salix udensis TaxID=889485 RepID=A0AAD6P657_9ROSI|nr:hypothetical protein OIU84_001655 [Salix udensis]